MINIESVFLETKHFSLLLSNKREFYITSFNEKYKNYSFNDAFGFYDWVDPCLLVNCSVNFLYKIDILKVLSSNINFKFFFFEMLSIFKNQCVKLVLALINNDFSQDFEKYANGLPLVYNCQYPIVCPHLISLVSKLMLHRFSKNNETNIYFK